MPKVLSRRERAADPRTAAGRGGDGFRQARLPRGQRRGDRLGGRLLHGAVYSNFSGKEELFLALADREVEERIAEIRAVGDSVEAGREAAAEAGAPVSGTAQRGGLAALVTTSSGHSAFAARGYRRSSPSAARRFRTRWRKRSIASPPSSASSCASPPRCWRGAIGATLNGLAFERAAIPARSPTRCWASSSPRSSAARSRSESTG